jgi:hypothetical protein
MNKEQARINRQWKTALRPAREFSRKLFPLLHVPRIETRIRKGRCYELTAQAMLEAGAASKWRLVHGTVMASDHPAVGHAWLKLTKGKHRFIYDAVKDCVFLADHYAELFGAKAIQSYTVKQAARMMIKSRTYGPWKSPAGVLYKNKEQK